MTVTRGHKNEALTNRNPGGLTRENHRSILRPNGPQAHAVAPLLCAGITTYSPLHQWGVGAGHKVGIVGLGGLGHRG